MSALTESSQSAESVEVVFHDESLHGGERVTFTLTKQGKPDTMLISANALKRDRSGTYIYVVKERQSTMGNSFFVERREVTVADSNENTVAVSEGLYDGELIIVDSNEPIQDGIRVRY
ncbi:hypothetical protein D3C76_1634060 [compost metagenome]